MLPPAFAITSSVPLPSVMTLLPPSLELIAPRFVSTSPESSVSAFRVPLPRNWIVPVALLLIAPASATVAPSFTTIAASLSSVLDVPIRLAFDCSVIVPDWLLTTPAESVAPAPTTVVRVLVNVSTLFSVNPSPTVNEPLLLTELVLPETLATTVVTPVVPVVRSPRRSVEISRLPELMAFPSRMTSPFTSEFWPSSIVVAVIVKLPLPPLIVPLLVKRLLGPVSVKATSPALVLVRTPAVSFRKLPPTSVAALTLTVPEVFVTAPTLPPARPTVPPSLTMAPAVTEVTSSPADSVVAPVMMPVLVTTPPSIWVAPEIVPLLANVPSVLVRLATVPALLAVPLLFTAPAVPPVMVSAPEVPTVVAPDRLPALVTAPVVISSAPLTVPPEATSTFPATVASPDTSPVVTFSVPVPATVTSALISPVSVVVPVCTVAVPAPPSSPEIVPPSSVAVVAARTVPDKVPAL